MFAKQKTLFFCLNYRFGEVNVLRTFANWINNLKRILPTNMICANSSRHCGSDFIEQTVLLNHQEAVIVGYNQKVYFFRKLEREVSVFWQKKSFAILWPCVTSHTNWSAVLYKGCLNRVWWCNLSAPCNIAVGAALFPCRDSLLRTVFGLRDPR